MSENIKTYNLTTASGCLSMDAIRRFNEKILTEEEVSFVNDHLSNCEMCSDAAEGMGLISDENKLNAVISEINENVRRQVNLKDRATRNIIPISNKVFYSGTAASIIILMGLLFYFQFYANNSSQGKRVVFSDQILQIPIPHEQMEVIENEELEISSDKKYETIIKDKRKPILKEITKQGIKKTEYKVQLDAMKTKDSGAFSAYSEKGQSVTKKSVDIASTLPPEYYLNSVTVSDELLDSSPEIINSKPQKNPKKSDKLEKLETEHFFQAIEKMPEYPGGQEAMFKFLYSNLKYPKQACESGLQGIVLVAFIVEEDGSISNTNVIQGIGGGCDEEAKRVIELMPQWFPAVANEKNGRVLFKIPIRFKLY